MFLLRPIHLTVTKGSAQGDTAHYSYGEKEVLQITPKQGDLPPQPLVHYVVEKLSGLRGTIRSLCDESVSDMSEEPQSEREALQAEALVEVFQSELWGTQVLDHEFIAMLSLICDNYGVPAVPLTFEQIAAGRKALRELSEQWKAVAVGGNLKVTLDPI